LNGVTARNSAFTASDTASPSMNERMDAALRFRKNAMENDQEPMSVRVYNRRATTKY
jgi:hypothetical protein